MNNISLSMSRGAVSTAISNRFIDEFMPQANGSYVKVYIYLLRLISESSELSLSLIADRLDETEKDIRRALKYWEEAGVLNVKYNSFGQITDIVILNTDSGVEQEKPAEIIQLHKGTLPTAQARTSIPEATAEAAPLPAVNDIIKPEKSKEIEKRPTYSAAQVNMFMKDKELESLIRSLDKRLNRPLNQADVQLVLFFFECLGFDCNLIYYLYDYCCSNGKTSNNYIEKVALNWAQAGIHTVEDAKAESAVHSSQSLAVMKAFGLSRTPAPSEQSYIGRWFNDFGFPPEVVIAACDRTILSIHKPDFKYTDRILESWNQKGFRSLADINTDDAEYSRVSKIKPAGTAQPRKQAAASGFNNFQQRDYDYNQLEQMLLNKQQG